MPFIPKGDITTIIGPSGEGKSVLLKHMIGLMRPDRGQVVVDGVNIEKIRDRERNEIRKKFSMLFQSAALFDSMNVFDNVAFPLREKRLVSASDIQRKVAEILERVGLGVKWGIIAGISYSIRPKLHNRNNTYR